MDNKARYWLLTLLVFVAAFARWIPHPPNFSPLIAVAFFAGARFESKKLALVVPFLALFLSDLLLGFYPFAWAIYLSYVAIVGVGVGMKTAGPRNKWLALASGSVLAAVAFFALTNFAVWAFGSLYIKTPEGLWQSYVAALPFFHNTLISTVAYTLALAGLEKVLLPLAQRQVA